MRLLAAALLLAALATGSPAPAQKVGATGAATPNSPQRRAILDALRPAVEARLGGRVEFVVGRLDVHRGWALVFADPLRPGGGRIDGRRYFADFDNMDGIAVTAVLRWRGGRWTLVDHAIGATDAWYCGTPRIAPAALTGC
jgi:hypothetical protein